MERFNQRVIRCLADFCSEGLLADATSVLYVDSKDNLPTQTPLTLVAGNHKKQRFKLACAWQTMKRRPDVVIYGHISLVHFALLARVLRPKCHHILLIHGVEVWQPPNFFRRYIVDRYVDIVASGSTRFAVEQMASAFRLPDEKLRVLGTSVDPSPLNEDRVEELQASLPGVQRILTVTRLVQEDSYKNVDKVILALPKLLERFPDLHYFVVGDGDLRTSLEDLADSTGVANNVHFLGRIPDETKDALYRACDVFVMISTGEGFGLVYLEAWDAGIPVVAAEKGAAAEVVRHGIDGFCITPTAEVLEETVTRLLEDRELRTKMGTAGNRRYNETFTHEAFKERLQQMLLGGQSGSASTEGT